MGIKGLTKFLENNFTFREVSLDVFEAVAIDGNSICCKLYEQMANWKMGGEYKEFSSIVKSFFDSIPKGVKPIVVVDGLRDINKIRVSCKRRESLNLRMEAMQKTEERAGVRIIPTLALPTFIIFVQDMGFELHVSAGEGDLLVASISNQTSKCPVVASDSDYFMYELRNGYIPFDKIGPQNCFLYHMDQFKAQFHLQDSMMRFIIPAKHGNDFICGEVSKYEEYFKTLYELPKYKDCNEYFSSHEYMYLRAKYERAKKHYYITSSPTDIIQSHVGETPNLSITISGSSIDTHFTLIRITTTNAVVMSNAVERISRESVWNCSQYIRQFLYFFLSIPEVEEVNRENGSSRLTKVIVKSKSLKPPVTLNEAAMLSLLMREEIVLVILKFNKMPEKYQLEFNKLPPEFKLPVAAAFYWHKTSDLVNTKLVQSLLLCFLNKEEHTLSVRKQINLDHLHAFSQWQSVYSDALALNYMMGSPLQATNPEMLFSGKKALYYASLGSDHLSSKFTEIQMMFEIVTSRKWEKAKNPAPISAPTTETSFVHKTPFSAFSDKHN